MIKNPLVFKTCGFLSLYMTIMEDLSGSFCKERQKKEREKICI